MMWYSMKSFAVVLVLGSCLLSPASALAQSEATLYVAHIHAGTCDAPGEVIAPLTDLQTLVGESVGAGQAVPTATSFSQVPIALQDLLATPTLIDVHLSGSEQSVACGEMGGVREPNGPLTIGLRPTADSGLSGIAYLNPQSGNPSQTGISAFLADTSLGVTTDTVADVPMDAETYAQDVRAQVTLVVASLQRVDQLFENPMPNDEAWKSQLASELALWQIIFDQAQQIVPPSELADFHSRYLAPLALLDSASLDITEGLAEGDQARLSEADLKISDAITALRELSTTAVEATPAGS